MGKMTKIIPFVFYSHKMIRVIRMMTKDGVVYLGGDQNRGIRQHLLNYISLLGLVLIGDIRKHEFSKRTKSIIVTT